MLQFTLRRSRGKIRFPNRIREYRLRAGLNQAALAGVIGRGRKVVGTWERGQKLPSLPDVFRLARALGTLAESLYAALYFPKHDDDPNPDPQ